MFALLRILFTIHEDRELYLNSESTNGTHPYFFNGHTGQSLLVHFIQTRKFCLNAVPNTVGNKDQMKSSPSLSAASLQKQGKKCFSCALEILGSDMQLLITDLQIIVVQKMLCNVFSKLRKRTKKIWFMSFYISAFRSITQ